MVFVYLSGVSWMCREAEYGAFRWIGSSPVLSESLAYPGKPRFIFERRET